MQKFEKIMNEYRNKFDLNPKDTYEVIDLYIKNLKYQPLMSYWNNGIEFLYMNKKGNILAIIVPQFSPWVGGCFIGTAEEGELKIILPNYIPNVLNEFMS